MNTNKQYLSSNLSLSFSIFSCRDKYGWQWQIFCKDFLYLTLNVSNKRTHLTINVTFHINWLAEYLHSQTAVNMNQHVFVDGNIGNSALPVLPSTYTHSFTCPKLPGVVAWPEPDCGCFNDVTNGTESSATRGVELPAPLEAVTLVFY